MLARLNILRRNRYKIENKNLAYPTKTFLSEADELAKYKTGNHGTSVELIEEFKLV